MQPPLPLLTIAGSDSGGAAGLQADLKTWAALGAYGMSAITAVTAQNSVAVRGVHFLPPEFVAAQIDAVLSDYGAAAIKTGFLGRVDIIEAVAERLAYWLGGGLEPRPALVVDPVLVNHRGESMFGPEVADAYRRLLFPLADLVTPNAAEAAVLGSGGAGEQGSRGAEEKRGGGAEEKRGGGAEEKRGGGAEEKRGGGAGERGSRGAEEKGRLGYVPASRLLLKGWRRDGGEVVDLYWDGEQTRELSQPRLDTINTHGSGDTLSAAICAFRAQGHDWLEAVNMARAYTHAAIERGAAWRLGEGHGPLGH